MREVTQMFRPRMLLVMLLLGLLLAVAAACGAKSEPAATATAVPATATPSPLTQAELQRLLIKISVPCRDILGLYETLSESHESLTPDDIRNGLVAKYLVTCKFSIPDLDAFPPALSLTISAFESPEAARKAVSSTEGENRGSVYSPSSNPSLGDKSAAASVLDKETGQVGEIIEVAVGTVAIQVLTLPAQSEEMPRRVAFSAARAMTENAAAMR